MRDEFDTYSLCIAIFEGRIGILYAVAIVTSIFSPFILNDVVVIILTPVIVRYAKQFGVDIAPLLVAEITFTNIASSMTPLANPQNILLWSASMCGIVYDFKHPPSHFSEIKQPSNLHQTVLTRILYTLQVHSVIEKTGWQIPRTGVVNNRLLNPISLAEVKEPSLGVIFRPPCPYCLVCKCGEQSKKE